MARCLHLVVWLCCRRRYRCLTILGLCALVILTFYVIDDATRPSREDGADATRQLRFDTYRRTQASRTGPGENGAAVELSDTEQRRARELFEREGMNIVASDKVALDRAIPDFRSIG